MNDDLDYQVYSDFKTSDWYIYWDKDYAYTKNSQMLVVWYIKVDNFTNYDYVTLTKLLKTDSAHHGLPYSATLSESAIKEFTSICKEFVADMDLEFGNED